MTKEQLLDRVPPCGLMCYTCPGCIEGCFIPECVKEHDVDFCAECDKFPCSKVRDSEIYGKEAREAMVEGSLLIKENGAERFFEMKKDASHYAKYKKTT